MKCMCCNNDLLLTGNVPLGVIYSCGECGCMITIPQHLITPNFDKPTGWICPVCGRGLAPGATECPCYKKEVINSTSTEQVIYKLSDYGKILNNGEDIVAVYDDIITVKGE